MSIITIALAGCEVPDVVSLCTQLQKGYGRNMLEAKPLVTFHEVDGAPINMVERLKALVTESELMIAEKFKATERLPVYTRFTMLINEYHKVELRDAQHETRRVLYLYTPAHTPMVEHLLGRLFEIKEDRQRATDAGLALLDEWAVDSPDVLPGLPPDTEIKVRVTKAFSGERGIHGHLSSFLGVCGENDVQPDGGQFFAWLREQHIKHRFTTRQLQAMIEARKGLEEYFALMNGPH